MGALVDGDCLDCPDCCNGVQRRERTIKTAAKCGGNIKEILDKHWLTGLVEVRKCSCSQLPHIFRVIWEDWVVGVCADTW